jgi:LDH2 family malate/lactate/ureidoglycolate dehydrogenase
VGSNIPPKSGIRVPPEEMSRLVARLFEKAGAGRQDAELMAHLLVQTDLRGVFSHGTWQTTGYARLMLNGRVNPAPNIRVVRETPTTRVLDGDGGMGHIPCFRGAEWAIATAKEFGTAAVTTRNHFHFGAASKYARMALEHDCIGVAISSHRYGLSPDDLIKRVNATSPISIAIPAGDQPPLVLDMGASMLPWDEELYARMPFTYFKELGIGAINQVMGAVLAGIYMAQFQPPQSPWESNQGGFIAVYDVECFMPVDEFKEEMDRFVGDARRMKPFPGLERAELPGGLEWQRERDYALHGIPIGPAHRQALEEIAAELGVETPFAEFEHTCFGT